VARKMARAPGAAAVIYSRPYGYGGSVYADTHLAPPMSQVMKLQLPGAVEFLPTGFYYLWQPGI